MNKLPKINSSQKLGIFPADWEILTLGDLFEFKNGINAAKEDYGSGVKFINVMEVINNEEITSDKIPGSVKLSEKKRSQYKVKNGDVLFNRTSETTEEIGLGSVYRGKNEVVFGGFVIRGRPLSSKLNDLFKKYAFRFSRVRSQIIRGGQGAIRSNISQGDLEKVFVAIPPKIEQTAIANLLSTWDRAITRTTQLIAQKELRKKWLMQQLLTGKKRLKGFSENWVFIKFGDIYSQIKEKAGGKKYLPLSVTKNGIVSQAEYFNKEIQSEDTSPYLVIRKGNMVMSGLNFWMGAIDVLTEFEVGIVSPAYKAFEIQNSNIHPEFMKFFVRSEIMLKALIGSSVQGASIVRRNLDMETLEEWSFQIPSLDEQLAIANVFKSANSELSLLRQKLDKLKEQKKGLMQVLLSGKKRLQRQ